MATWERKLGQKPRVPCPFFLKLSFDGIKGTQRDKHTNTRDIYQIYSAS
jgi:hypothetical protein